MLSEHRDEKGVRYRLISKNGEGPNWLFLAGGPGADSSLFNGLVSRLNLPGHIWYIDLPGQGDNWVLSPDYQEWPQHLLSAVSQFSEPVLVGQSYGGIMSLFLPELEQLLAGLILIGAAPCDWREASTQASQGLALPDRERALSSFHAHPSDKSYKECLLASLPRLFCESAIKEGRELIEQTVFPYEPALWLLRNLDELPFDQIWIPQQVPTLILSGKEDKIHPPYLFERDKRFSRENIKLYIIEGAGHIPWVEKGEELARIFHAF